MSRNREMYSSIVKNSSWWHQRSLIEQVLLMLCLIFAVVAITLSITLFVCIQFNIRPNNRPELQQTEIRAEALQTQSVFYVDETDPKIKNICQAPGCVKAASTILLTLDDTVDPCYDFYDFACGKFLKETNIPEEKTHVDTFTLVEDKLQAQIFTIITEESEEGESKPFTLAKHYYQSCMNKSIIEERGLKPLQELFDLFGGWPVVVGDEWDVQESSWDWKDAIKKFREIGLQDDHIMAFGVSTNLTNSSSRSIQIDQSELALNRKYIIKGMGNDIVTAYYSYMVDTAISHGAEVNRARQDMLDALQFETALANISLAEEDRRNLSALNNPFTIRHIQQMYPYMDWLAYINSLLPSNLTVDENEYVSVAVPTFFAQLGHVLTSTPKRTIANYFLWRVAYYLASHLPKIQRDRELQYLAKINGQQAEEPRWKECIDYTSSKLPISTGALYVRKYFDEESKREASDMIANIQYEFRNILEKATWMDDSTKKEALRKAKALVSHIGYPSELTDNAKLEKYYETLEIERDNWLVNVMRIRKFDVDLLYGLLREPTNKTDWKNHATPAVVNAFYNPLENSIQFPAGILQDKFYNVENPRYRNYAAIGSIVAHEITHGFDDVGRQFDLDGNLVDWWGDETRIQFLANAQCIIDQYDNFTDPQTQLQLNGVNTQGENIADNGGVKQAYYAYKRWATRNENEGTLPGLNYSIAQLFWISNAQMWCSVSRDEYRKLEITTDEHPPKRFRVNGPLSNLGAFANDFNCPKGSPMNPEWKCEVW